MLSGINEAQTMSGGYAVRGLPWRVPLNSTKLSLFCSSSYVLYLESTIVAFGTVYHLEVLFPFIKTKTGYGEAQVV